MSSKEEALTEYSRLVEELRGEAGKEGLTSEEFNILLSETLNEVAKEMQPPTSIFKLMKKIMLKVSKLLLVVILVYALVSCHTPTQKSLSRHIQGFIYPFMRTLRKITLPILHSYPELAGKN
jgi:hypothetical protein